MDIVLIIVMWLLVGFVSGIATAVGYWITEDYFTLADAVMIPILTLLGVISFIFFIYEFKSDIYFWADNKIIFRRKG